MNAENIYTKVICLQLRACYH